MSLAVPRTTFHLADGRELTYIEVGDPKGTAVVHHHGGLASAADVLPIASAAAASGIRLIAADRPGIAGSTLVKDRTILDGLRDTEELLNHLNISEVRLMGWSMGGPYALASAYRLADRVVRTALIASPLPLDTPGALAELNRMDQRFTSMAVEHATQLRAIASTMGGLAHFAPKTWARMAVHGEGAADETAARTAARALADSSHDAMHQPQGIVEEYLAWTRPWGFDLDSISTHVDVWQGTEDHLVPEQWASRLADDLPQGELHLIESEGHFLLLNRASEVFQTLLTTS